MRFLLLFFLPFTLPAQQTWHVNVAAAGTNDGKSWANAFTDLHQALGAAKAGDAVWVAQGKYVPDGGNNRARPFALPSGVRLHGGFAGTERSLAERGDPLRRETLLSGDIGTKGDSTDNAFTILYLSYPDSTTLVEGLVLEHGYAETDTSFNNTAPSRAGGAVYIQASRGVSLPTFRRCEFRHNAAAGLGGAVCVRAPQTVASTPVFQYCTFFNNLSGAHGGAVFLSGGAPVDRGIEFYHCVFRNNRSLNQAGGLYIEKSVGSDVIDLVGCEVVGNIGDRIAGFLTYQLLAKVPLMGLCFDSCRFEANICNKDGAMIFGTDVYDWGDANTRGRFVLKNSIVEGHYLKRPSVGSLLGFGGWNSTKDTLWVLNNVFKNNLSRSGISIAGSFQYINSVIKKNIFINNKRAPQYFAPPFISAPIKSEISYNLFLNNEYMFLSVPGRTEPDGIHNIHHNVLVGNVVPDSSSGSNVFGLIYTLPTTRTGSYALSNNLFLNNRIIDRYALQPSSKVRAIGYCANNIFLNNRNGLDNKPTLPIPLTEDSLFFRHNLMDIDCKQLWGRFVFCQEGNLLGRPLFVDSLQGDYRLRPCSPGVDAGDAAALRGAAVDYMGNPRIMGAEVDMGPFESLWPAKPNLAFGGDSLTCPGLDDGLLSAFAEMIAAPATYSWSNGATTPSIAGLAPGTYTYTATDAFGCANSATAVVREALPLLVSATVSKTTGPDQRDGRIQVAVTNGTGPFQYRWEHGPVTATVENLAPGTYTLTVEDGGGGAYRFSYMVEAGTIGTADPQTEGTASVWPNPASDRVWVRFGSEHRAWWLLSPEGRLLLRLERPQTGAEAAVELGHLPSGHYAYVFVEGSGGFVPGMLIIEN